MARVVVVGGGYGGVTVAKGLDPLAEVILVEQKDQFVHHAAALRAAVDEAWQHSIFMPYSNLLSNGQVIHGTVSQVEGTRVHIFGQEPIDADYVVLATGSTYPFPAKYSASRSDVAKARLKQLHSYLHGARSVLLVLNLQGNCAMPSRTWKLPWLKRNLSFSRLRVLLMSCAIRFASN